jgi:hypothetical protein
VVPTDAAVDVEEQLPPVLRGDTPQEHLGGALAVKLPEANSVALSEPDEPAGVSDINGEDPPLEEVEEGSPPIF